MAIKLSDYEKEHRKAVKHLDKYVKANYTEEQQDVMEWYNDESTATHYIWKFVLEGKTIELKIGLNDTVVHIREV